jgi:hypothetical protein
MIFKYRTAELKRQSWITALKTQTPPRLERHFLKSWTENQYSIFLYTICIVGPAEAPEHPNACTPTRQIAACGKQRA